MAKTKGPTVGPKGGTGTPPKPQRAAELLAALKGLLACIEDPYRGLKAKNGLNATRYVSILSCDKTTAAIEAAHAAIAQAQGT